LQQQKRFDHLVTAASTVGCSVTPSTFAVLRLDHQLKARRLFD